MKQKLHIHWFRNDLRIKDHPLFSDINSTDALLPIYIFNENEFLSTQYGFQKSGPFKWQFMIENLIELRETLRKKGSDLWIFKGNTIEIIRSLMSFYTNATLSFSSEYAFDEQEEERSLLKLYPESKIYHHSTLLQTIHLPFSIKNLPDVFTNFRIQVEKNWTVRPLFPEPDTLPPLPEKWHSSIDIPETHTLFPDFRHNKQKGHFFIGGEYPAHERLNEYLFLTQKILTYKESRNGLLHKDDSSKLSPWLSSGAISAVQIYYSIKKFEQQFEANESTYWLIFELLWRDYFKFVSLKYGRKLFVAGGFKGAKKQGNFDKEIFESWKSGNTGNDFIDANMRELAATGFMSNRGRQNVASYLVNDLKIDWRAGAAWMEHALVDYDPSSNWCNWAYIAGVGNDPRPYRYFNIQKQAAQYDPDAAYRNYWLN